MIILCPGRHAATIPDVGQPIRRIRDLMHEGHAAQLLQWIDDVDKLNSSLDRVLRRIRGRRTSGYEAVRP